MVSIDTAMVIDDEDVNQMKNKRRNCVQGLGMTPQQTVNQKKEKKAFTMAAVIAERKRTN